MLSGKAGYCEPLVLDKGPGGAQPPPGGSGRRLSPWSSRRDGVDDRRRLGRIRRDGNMAAEAFARSVLSEPPVPPGGRLTATVDCQDLARPSQVGGTSASSSASTGSILSTSRQMSSRRTPRRPSPPRRRPRGGRTCPDARRAGLGSRLRRPDHTTTSPTSTAPWHLSVAKRSASRRLVPVVAESHSGRGLGRGRRRGDRVQHRRRRGRADFRAGDLHAQPGPGGIAPHFRNDLRSGPRSPDHRQLPPGGPPIFCFEDERDCKIVVRGTRARRRRSRRTAGLASGASPSPPSAGGSNRGTTTARGGAPSSGSWGRMR